MNAVDAKFSFDAKNFPIAVGRLFEMNNYDVEYDIHLFGAQIDIIARSKSDPFSKSIYIEATIEYISNDKYGKDATKFLLIQRHDPGATCLSVSSIGFTAAVRERATESGITISTYRDLFRRFEKFAPYIEATSADEDLRKLDETYEEPNFSDAKGTEYATDWLDKWVKSDNADARWLIILGEYGTGKTSLTRVLQRRWANVYASDPEHPIPIRIELRSFSRQFDASGLLHHFLDRNNLGHVPIAFVTHLIRTGRVVLLLDGYDEMAQYLNMRERRACLNALAELAAEGAKGILTSRPNYFTENEELNVFEALYSSVQHSQYHISQSDKLFLIEEKNIDELIERYVLNRYERSLRDLTPEQTESLVKRNLKDDIDGQNLILSILSRVFREETKGRQQSLSGKPVIIAYLLELVDDFRKDKSLSVSSITEYQIYKLIVDRLMFRDLRRSTLDPNVRRVALQKLAMSLSGRDSPLANESLFQQIIEDEFRTELRRLLPDERRTRKDELFEDLRSSSTLTRSQVGKAEGWSFSHNSLREFLTTEFLLGRLGLRLPVMIKIPITSPMQNFAASVGETEQNMLWDSLESLWPERSNLPSMGSYLSIMWDAACKRPGGLRSSLLSLPSNRHGDYIDVSNISLKKLDFSHNIGSNSIVIDASNADLSEINFDRLALNGSSFKNSLLDSVSFVNSSLIECDFRETLLFECDLSHADVTDADFRGLDKESTFVIYAARPGPSTPLIGFNILTGAAAIGYLRYNGANTDDVEDYLVYVHHPKFPIVEKVCERITEQRNTQLRGLTQRGEARADPPFAREFVTLLVRCGWIEIIRSELVSATPSGRNVLAQIVDHGHLPLEVKAFLDASDL